LRYQLRVNPSVPPEIRADSDKEIDFLSMDAIGEDGSIRLDTVRPISELLTGYSYFENNDVLLAKVTPCFENGKGALLQELPQGAGFGTTEVTVLRASPTLDSRFLYYLTTEDRFKQGGVASMTGAGGLKRVPDSYVRDFEFFLPETAEQRQIADYLDAHTANIDLLIEKQERLIETLAERRRAVISDAVTKGLDPNVPMKDSGVEWLGAIPVSWSVPRVAHNYSIVLGKMVNAGKESTSGAYSAPYLRAGNVQPYGVDITEVRSMPMTASELAQLSLRFGDLVVVEGGQGGYGRSALVLEDLAGWGFQNHVMRVRPKPSVSNAFLDYVLKTLRAAGYIASLSSHASLPSFSAEKLSAIRYGMPIHEEQVRIVEHLDRETAQIVELSAKAREMIDVLKERRQALISAAVTGKIDVRGLS
jgi:type I restriction enzyme S subunit